MTDPLEAERMLPPHSPGRGRSPRGDPTSVALLGTGALILLAGAGLAYAALFRRWGYYSGMSLDLSTLTPQDRASMTIYWWDSTNNCCGPFPAVWPALALLAALPLFIAAVRGRAAMRWWSRLGLLSALGGFATVLLADAAFVVPSWASDSGWVYSLDTTTLAIALSGYALLFAGVLVLSRLSRPDVGASCASGTS